MSASFFRFKQFVISHDLCAMKTGTDGVLLGAWTHCADAAAILDVGTGSGLIALMLAQRSKGTIDAIDIDENAYKQAKINFAHSPFAEQVNAFHVDFLHYAPSHKYDLIVSNPPYFMDSSPSPYAARTTARHNCTLNLDELVQKSTELLSSNGRLSLIVPIGAFDLLQSITTLNNLYLTRKTVVRSLENRPPKRTLLEYSKQMNELDENEFFIENSNHTYSPEYIELTKSYYLAF
ncbi:MAG: methyltransferase [Candidatus Azobacteroides sp.]|nr:methyltransferase [Candidatus Azobacteroides sp.]